MKVALVGSRETPQKILREVIKVATWLREHNHIGRSGHADGFDLAAEVGMLTACEVFLPWRGFNSDKPIVGTPFIVGPDPKLDVLVSEYHPAPNRLSRGAWKLMRRNGCQVLGRKADDPVNAIVCWRIESGGTDQALRIGRSQNIPIINMSDAKYSTADLVIAELRKIFNE